MIIFLKT
ncbi:hypothetical protein PENPOL_c003G07844 [Penicillium polonicum]|nr:hypothetical protein PENPOL_c003G07844 [Penicillium polonicum]